MNRSINYSYKNINSKINKKNNNNNNYRYYYNNNNNDDATQRNIKIINTSNTNN